MRTGELSFVISSVVEDPQRLPKLAFEGVYPGVRTLAGAGAGAVGRIPRFARNVLESC